MSRASSSGATDYPNPFWHRSRQCVVIETQVLLRELAAKVMFLRQILCLSKCDVQNGYRTTVVA